MPAVELHSFSAALYLCKRGARMARQGWSKRNIKWVEIVSVEQMNCTFPALVYPPGSMYPEGIIAPWTPTRCDMMEDDWYVIDIEEASK